MQATLDAGATLDFNALDRHLPPAGERPARLETGNCSTSYALSATDLDMRLSAAKVTVGCDTNSAAPRSATNLRGGALALSVGEAQMYGGIAKGSFGSRAVPTRWPMSSHQFQFTDVRSAGLRQRIVRHHETFRPRQSQRLAGGFRREPVRPASSLRGTATLTGT